MLLCMTTLLNAFPLTTEAQKVVYDFENCPIGQKFTMWNVDRGNVTTSTAEVVVDPTNSNNKVLHVVLKDWGTFVTLTLPPELAGHQLTDKKQFVAFDLYRPSTDADDYKQFHVYLGKDKLYQDESYPYQGDRGTWQRGKTYALSKVSTASDNEVDFHMGLHHNNTEYYIDNITFKGKYDDYFVADDSNNLIDICESNTASSYKVWSTPILVGKGKTLDIKTSRYTYLNSTVEGEGTINLYAGGERTYLGSNDKNAKNYHPDWNNFAGTLNIYPYKEVEKGAGFYGLVWMSGKTFVPDNAAQNALEGNINGCFAHSKVILRQGAALACESGQRGLRIAHLETEPESFLYGYIKNNSKNSGFYMVGADNEDATLAGRIMPMGGTNLNVKVGIVKEGNGTYRITGNDNLITGGIRVLNGSVMINNDITKAEDDKLSGGVGHQYSPSATGIYVMKKGSLGGIGNIASNTDVYGTVAPGDEGIGKLTIKDFVKGNKLSLIMHPKAKIVCEVNDDTHYDQLIVDGNLKYDNRKEDFDTSEDMPRLYINLTSNPTLKVGDELPLIIADGKVGDWNFDIRYPKQYTWKTEERQLDDTHYQLVATVTSLEYSGQGDVKDDDDIEDIKPDENNLDIEGEKTNTTPLRTYAENLNKYIGTCVSLYDGKINIDDENDAKTQMLKNQFNMVVCENEMKFDATEPSRGEFNYYNGDRMVAFAKKHNMRVRGHALVWHQQTSTWVSSDGKKNDKNFTSQELLDIMQNHISNVVGHWKGQVAEWDVCNEVLDDDQSIVRTDPNGFKLRAASIWNYAGTDYVEKAFRMAHEADPNAELILNDYGAEFKGNAKAEAFYNLAKYLKEKGAPITGVGLQCHLDAGNVDIQKLKATFDRFNAIGLKCVITELDLGMDNSETARALQAKDYYNIAKTAMEAENCDELMIWGLTDGMTWRNGRYPLLFDADLNMKDAYYGTHIAMRYVAPTTGIEDVTTAQNQDLEVISTNFYNLQGQKLPYPQAKGLYIIQQKMKDGSIKTKTVLNK